MANKAKRHTHKYQRVSLGFADVWRCASPGCPHYMPPHMEGMIEGKYSICWECNRQFTLDAGALDERQPRCLDCRTGGIALLEDFIKSKTGTEK